MEVLTVQTGFCSYYTRFLSDKVFEYLSKEEELELIEKAQNGNKKAVERLIMANYGYIVKFAKNHQHPGTTMDDLIDTAVIGFINAINKYNPEKGTRLITLAHFQLMDAFKTESESSSILKGADEKKVCSLNTKLNKDDSGAEFGDYIASESLTPEELFEKNEFRTCLRKSVNLLPEKECRVAELAFGLVKPKHAKTHKNAFGEMVENRMTLESIGDELNLSKQRVQQLFVNVKTLLQNEEGAGKFVAGYIAA